MRKILLFCLLSLCITALGCTQNDIIKSDYTVKSGSSFGMCVENCYQELSMNEYQAVLRIADRISNDPEVHAKRSVGNEEWNQILNQFDEEAFRALPEVIGCPDCADGGAEWIEVQSPDLVKKVTFEYRNPPAAIEDLANTLREKRGALFTPKDSSSN